MTTRNGADIERPNGTSWRTGAYGWNGAYDWDHTAQAAAGEAEPERVGPSVSQIVGSAAAAVSAALVASKLGVAGTLIGAAVASIVSTIGAAYYTSFASTAHDRVRRLGTLVPARRTGTRRWWVGAVAAFLLAVAAITAVELGLGHPVSASENSGTSVGTVLQAPVTQGTPTPEATTPAASGGSTATQAPTESATASATASAPGDASTPAPTASTAPAPAATSPATSAPAAPAR